MFLMGIVVFFLFNFLFRWAGLFARVGCFAAKFIAEVVRWLLLVVFVDVVCGCGCTRFLEEVEE